MGGRHITITCNFCGFVNKMERIIAEGETERTIRMSFVRRTTDREARQLAKRLQAEH